MQPRNANVSSDRILKISGRVFDTAYRAPRRAPRRRDRADQLRPALGVVDIQRLTRTDWSQNRPPHFWYDETAIASMPVSSPVDCVPWAFGTSLPHRFHLGRMALPNGRSGRYAASAWIISSFSARPIYAESCDATRATTTTSERIDHWIKMRRSLVQFSGPGASNRSPS
jgi:hypothetical protein